MANKALTLTIPTEQVTPDLLASLSIHGRMLVRTNIKNIIQGAEDIYDRHRDNLLPVEAGMFAGYAAAIPLTALGLSLVWRQINNATPMGIKLMRDEAHAKAELICAHQADASINKAVEHFKISFRQKEIAVLHEDTTKLQQTYRACVAQRDAEFTPLPQLGTGGLSIPFVVAAACALGGISLQHIRRKKIKAFTAARDEVHAWQQADKVVDQWIPVHAENTP